MRAQPRASLKRIVRHLFHRWLAPVCDPLVALRGLRRYPHYIAEWRRYTQLPGAEPLRLADAYPQLHDRTATSSIDPHYFYVNGWAMRRIVAQRPAHHVDIASQTIFVNLLAAVLPVTFVDYRPLQASLAGLTPRAGDILDLPFADGALASVSCLHVAEHIGLGRYGDPLNPQGTRQACAELARVLAPGGQLYFAVPVGRPRVCFNAHRIHAVPTILEYFSALALVEFSAVHDDGRYEEDAALTALDNSDYACGLFLFTKT